MHIHVLFLYDMMILLIIYVHRFVLYNTILYIKLLWAVGTTLFIGYIIYPINIPSYIPGIKRVIFIINNNNIFPRS